MQQEIEIEIKIERDSKNTSIIKIVKNDSDVSGEHKISPENESLSPYFDSLSPVSNKLSPEEYHDLSTKSDDSGDTGNKSDNIVENTDVREINNYNDNNIHKNCNCPYPSDPRIKYNHPFYYCKEHPEFENIYLKVIENHLILAKDHKKDTAK